MVLGLLNKGAEEAFGKNTKQINISMDTKDTDQQEVPCTLKLSAIELKLRGTPAPITKSKRAMKALAKKTEKENSFTGTPKILTEEINSRKRAKKTSLFTAQ
jgi:hypothetical protein